MSQLHGVTRENAASGRNTALWLLATTKTRGIRAPTRPDPAQTSPASEERAGVSGGC
ncbi:hypothetical protein ACFCVY_15065 [Streptomyces sp. NPDC056411]|uniref:hypothetical protein n=1 Tax=Streptomyces sp. NPDC056411 TaxID=3345813 RepID=UPI0035D8DD12